MALAISLVRNSLRQSWWLGRQWLLLMTHWLCTNNMASLFVLSLLLLLLPIVPLTWAVKGCWWWSPMKCRCLQAGRSTARTRRGRATWRTRWRPPPRPWWASTGTRTALQLWDSCMTTTRCRSPGLHYNIIILILSHIWSHTSYCNSCQVRERGRASSAVKPTDLSALGASNCGHLEILDQHLQALRSMPVNLSLNNSSTTTTEHQGFKYGPTGLAGDTRGGDGRVRGGAALAMVKTEQQASMGMPSCGVSCLDEPRERLQMVYEPSCYDSLSGYLRDDERSTPDSSTYEDAGEGEVSLFFYTFCFTLFCFSAFQH